MILTLTVLTLQAAMTVSADQAIQGMAGLSAQVLNVILVCLTNNYV